jgi:hypothetical protein
MTMLQHTASVANSSIPHNSDLHPPSQHIILYNKLYQAIKRQQRCTSNQRRPPSVWRGAIQMDMRTTPVVLNKRACTYSTSGPFVYNLYSIQKLKSPKNWRSIQISTLWAGLTNTNDMRIDDSRGHRLLTPGQARSKQKVSGH